MYIIIIVIISLKIALSILLILNDKRHKHLALFKPSHF